MSTTERKTFSERCHEECTRDVIFLFQRRTLELHGVPYGYDTADEGRVIMTRDDDDNELDEPVEVSREKLLKDDTCFGDWDHPCVTERWATESVWLSREEATAFGNCKGYNYSEGWRVYGICAEGELAELIKST